MKKHATIHSDIKPFICDVCDKSFKRKEDLKEHKKWEKARHCEIWGVPFDFKVQLQKHKEEKHNELLENVSWVKIVSLGVHETKEKYKCDNKS